MNDQKWKNIIKGFAFGSAVIAFAEGLIYFNAGELGLWPYFVSTVQNAVHTFLFDADISASAALEFSRSGVPFASQVISWVYMIAVLLAPVCSAVAVYSTAEILLRQKLNPFMGIRREPIIIFGEHESLTSAITNDDSRKYHFYLFTKNVADEELDILRKNTVIVKIDDYYDHESNVEILKTHIVLKKVRRIVIAQNTMADTMALYLWIAQMCKDGILQPGIKVYALCNGFGGERILEEIYEKEIKNDDMPELITYDSHEISARKLLLDNLTVSKDADVHAVITGTTPLMQQIITNLINLSVAGADSRITIDIIDAHADSEMQVFARRFSPDYISMNDKKWTLGGDSADGQLEIRFHNADPKKRAYRDLLSSLYDSDGPFTFAVVGLSNADECLSAMEEIENIIRQKSGDARIPIGLRIDSNKLLADNLSKYFPNVFTFDDHSGNVSLEDIFYESVDKKAKEFNYIYSSIQLLDKKEAEAIDAVCETDPKQDESDLTESLWRNMMPFQRTSSRLLADHCKVKETVTDMEVLGESMGENGSILKRLGRSFVMYGDDEDFLRRLAGCPEMEDMAKLEHRRWCYAMATNGWSWAPGKKNPVMKTNSCLVSWEKLKETRPDMCKYDLIPYMYMLIDDK